jgi:xylulose-5-phosphate/fructose-6-phosphate phosphoketolase
VVLPILHLNGYKIANPCAAESATKLEHLFRGYGYTPYFVEGDEPEKMHQLMAATLDAIIEDIQSIKSGANGKGQTERPLWPMIVLRSPKGWRGPKEVDGKKTEGFWRSQPGPREVARGMDEKLSPRRVFRFERAAEARAGGVGS